MPEFEHGESDIVVSQEVFDARQVRLAIEQEARRQRDEFVARMKQQYVNLSLEDAQQELDQARKEINEIEEGREPYSEGPFIAERVFRALVEESKRKTRNSPSNQANLIEDRYLNNIGYRPPVSRPDSDTKTDNLDYDERGER